ncbi:aldo/keto reductase [Petrotoga sp. HWH.PT.55.6.1]|uniref:aldo/keto reductase n=1 Tax=unclassified Petrotoga TaxID=2620614 RepID=UPI000CA00DED|nr:MULTISPECIES: aldo/keto reductase [unclassified Petrotoga]RPD35970.1 aldo/keto reductase [Petrotoga sp. HWH.PT.55.6.1]
MIYRKLGSSDLEVSMLGFGCWPVGGEWTEAKDSDSIKTIKEAIKLGINFFDVAPVYGFGHAEEVLGKAIKGKRKDIYIASKCGLRWDSSKKITRNLSRNSILEEIDNSLRRLETDYLDLYQIHWPDPNTPLEETLDTLNELKKEGKIRNIGVSNFSAFLIERAQELSQAEIVSNQVLYNLIDRNSDHYHDLPLVYRTENEILPFSKDNRIGIIPYSPLAQGLLTDGFDIGKISKFDVRTANPELKGEKLKKNLEIVGKLKNIAKDINRPLAQIAINWLASHAEISTIIAGATNVEQLRENVASFDWEMEVKLIERINSIFK